MSDALRPKTKSGAMRIGLVPCPACIEAPAGAACAYCQGARFVAVDRAIEYNARRDTDPAPSDPDQKPPK